MPAVPSKEIGAIGLRHYGGVLREELHRDLQGDRAIAVYSQMEFDPIVAATLLAVGELVRSAGFTIEAADTDVPAAVEAAEFVEGCLDDMSHTWTDFWAELSSVFAQGWAFFEIVYKARNGPDGEPQSRFTDDRVGWRKWAVRPQDTRKRWTLDESGGIQEFVQAKDLTGSGLVGTGEEVTIPIDKGLLFRTTHRKNNPEGRSMLRSAYEPWYYRRRMAVVSAIGAERNLAGIPRMAVPSEVVSGTTEAGAAAKAQWEQLGRDLRVDESAFVMVPSDRDEHGQRMYEVDLMGPAGTSGVDVEGIIERLSREIAMSVLADVIFLGHEQIGTQALARERGSLLKESLQGIANTIAETVTNHAISRLMRLNGFDRESWPEMKAGEIQQVDLGILGTFIADLARGGFTLGDDFDLENALRRVADLPDRDKPHEDTLAPSTLIDPVTGLPVAAPPGVAAAPPQSGQRNGQNGQQANLPPASAAANPDVKPRGPA